MAEEIVEEEITITELISDGLKMMKMLAYYNMIITEADKDERKKQVLETLGTEGLQAHNSQNNDYDYVIADNIRSPKDIYSTYLQHNGKLIIFDTDKLFSRKEYLDILEGGGCSSPDSSTKWKVQYRQEKPFSFTGHAIILTSKSKKELFGKKEKYKYLLRDLSIV